MGDSQEQDQGQTTDTGGPYVAPNRYTRLVSEAKLTVKDRKLFVRLFQQYLGPNIGLVSEKTFGADGNADDALVIESDEQAFAVELAMFIIAARSVFAAWGVRRWEQHREQGAEVPYRWTLFSIRAWKKWRKDSEDGQAAGLEILEQCEGDLSAEFLSRQSAVGQLIADSLDRREDEVDQDSVRGIRAFMASVAERDPWYGDPTLPPKDNNPR